MPTGSAYPSWHLVLYPFWGLAYAPIVETSFPELAKSLFSNYFTFNTPRYFLSFAWNTSACPDLEGTQGSTSNSVFQTWTPFFFKVYVESIWWATFLHPTLKFTLIDGEDDQLCTSLYDKLWALQRYNKNEVSKQLKIYKNSARYEPTAFLSTCRRIFSLHRVQRLMLSKGAKRWLWDDITRFPQYFWQMTIARSEDISKDDTAI